MQYTIADGQRTRGDRRRTVAGRAKNEILSPSQKRHPPASSSAQLVYSRTYETQAPALSPRDDLSRKFSCSAIPVIQSSEKQLNPLPGPPFEKLFDLTSRDRARNIFKKVHDVAPKRLIVEVSVHGAPRRDTGKSETNLQMNS